MCDPASGDGDSGGIRTPDPQLRRLLLYPAELRNLNPAAKLNLFPVCATAIFSKETGFKLCSSSPAVN